MKSTLTFRLSDEREWASPSFDADSPDALRFGVRATWDAIISDRTGDGAHPAFALASRLREIDSELEAKLTRPGTTSDQRLSWESNATHRRFVAQRDLGGSASRLRLHVQSATVSTVWLVPGNKTQGPAVGRTVSIDDCAAWFEGSQRVVAHHHSIGAFAGQVGDAVRTVQFPALALATSTEDAQ